MLKHEILNADSVNDSAAPKPAVCRGVMFDLDGTLADTLQDIAEAGNAAMREVGRPTYDVQKYRTLAGQGLSRLISDALGTEYAGLYDQAFTAFHAHYAEHRYDHTAPYAGVAQLLDELTARGLTLTVMSNKPDAATCDMADKVFGKWAFAAVRGHREGYPVKPDPKAALEIAKELSIEPGHWCYVGDTDVDMQTGKSAGFYTVGVTWGFRDEKELRDAGADAIIHEPGKLLTLLPA